jgi:adenylyltransferase/sulfurtransferase
VKQSADDEGIASALNKTPRNDETYNEKMNASRYARLQRLPGMEAGKFDRLRRSRAALVGCGTLGGIYAQNLVRCGIAFLRLIDRDVVEEPNLATQILFDQEDVRQALPKAEAARLHLQKVNADCRLEACVSDLAPTTAQALLGGVDLIIDATDNFETRFLINDAAVELNVPWIYTAVVGFTGLCLAIVPGNTACLRCLMDEPPPTGSLPTCETAGVWPPAAQSLAAVGMTQALRLLTGDSPSEGLIEVDLQQGTLRVVNVPRREDCPTCVRKDFVWLEGRRGSQAVRLCGRDMVHLSPQSPAKLDLPVLAQRLGSAFQVQLTDYLLHLTSPEAEIYLFPDGRALVKGVTDPARARALYNRFITV